MGRERACSVDGQETVEILLGAALGGSEHAAWKKETIEIRDGSVGREGDRMRLERGRKGNHGNSLGRAACSVDGQETMGNRWK